MSLSHWEDRAGLRKHRVAGGLLLDTKWGHWVGRWVFEFRIRGTWEAGWDFPGWCGERREQETSGAGR